MCFDDNYDYEDGCELAVDYPIEWAENDKTAYDHWMSPIADLATGSHSYAETTYWLRDDGYVTLGRARPSSSYTTAYNGFITVEDDEMEPTDNAWDHWVELFDMVNSDVGVVNGEWNETATTIAEQGYTLVDVDDRTDFDFAIWDVRAVTGYIDAKWYGDMVDSVPDGANVTVDGYNFFPWTTNTSSYDCSNADLPSGTDWVPISDRLNGGVIRWVEVDWTLTTSMKGPWFHVNQSALATTGCNAGYDSAATWISYGQSGKLGWGPVITPLDYCWNVPRTPAFTGTFNRACFDDWEWPGSGLCKLDCEAGWADRDMDPTNGCESFLANGFPLPRSRCGSTGSADVYDDPATFNLTLSAPRYNYNQDSACGAGVCIGCQNLGGVNTVQTAGKFLGDAKTEAGTRSFCLDGGNDWIAADASLSTVGDKIMNASVENIEYPGDYYCSGILNQNACLRVQLSYACPQSYITASLCPKNSYWGANDTQAAATSSSILTDNTNSYAKYFQVCEDRDEIWTTGCEVALAYNFKWDTTGENVTVINGFRVVDEEDSFVTLQGVYDRSIGVKPKWDKNFTEIDWDGGVQPGFDCDILRLLPREHTHIKPQSLSGDFIGCSLSGNQGEGTCQFKCDGSWSDCDGNPWNGCEQSDVLCAGSGASACNDPQGYPTGAGIKPPRCNNYFNDNDVARTPFCDGNQLPTDDWYDYFVSETGAVNYDDQGEYDELFEIYDHGLNWVDVTTDYVDPDVSRYTIQGYWDNDEIDYSCRVWLDFYNFTKYTVRTKNISADANAATGRCVLDCDEVNGVSNYNGNDLDGCQSHIDNSFCRLSSGDGITSRLSLPGVQSSSASKCQIGRASCRERV